MSNAQCPRTGARESGARWINCRLESRAPFADIQGMTAEELRPLLRGSATRPITVHADGKAYPISHPEFALLTSGGATLIVLHREDNGFDLLDMPLIARVEVHGDGKAAPST